MNFNQPDQEGYNDGSLQSIILAMWLNFQKQLTSFVEVVPSFYLFKEPDLNLISSHISDENFNCVFGANFVSGRPQEKVREVIHFFMKERKSFTWWIGPFDYPLYLDQLLQAHSFQLISHYVGMYLELESSIYHKANDSLKIKRIASQQEIRDFADLVIEFGLSKDIYEQFYSQIPKSFYQKQEYGMYVGYDENRPVVAAVLLFHAAVAGIYYLITKTGERRRGFGTIMASFLLETARSQGCRFVVLQASEKGLKMYEKLGFKPCCHYQEYVYGNEDAK